MQKLNKPDDSLSWKCRICDLIRHEETLLVGPKDKPEEGALPRCLTEWTEKNAKDKSTIVRTLGESASSKVSTLIDNDERTAKELWEKIA